MSKYQLITDELTQRTSIYDNTKNAHIPIDPENTDYQAYLAWVAEGNEAEEWTGE